MALEGHIEHDTFMLTLKEKNSDSDVGVGVQYQQFGLIIGNSNHLWLSVRLI